MQRDPAAPDLLELRLVAAQAALGLENARRLDELRKHAEQYRILHANTQRIIESSAAAILEPLYESRLAWDRLVALLEAQEALERADGVSLPGRTQLRLSTTL